MQARTLLVLFVAHALAAAAVARAPLAEGRKLLQGASAFCPDGCEDGFCQQSGTPGGLLCTKCKGNLVVDKASGMCACPKGKYSTGSETCVDCPKGSYCIGGIFSKANPPTNVSCPVPMTTPGLRSSSSRSCVNPPGYSYSIDSAGVPSATICPEDTYGPGLRKQRACVPCFPGFSTAGRTGAFLPVACVVPAGFYLKSPGVAAPCPKGEYKVGLASDGACVKCAPGVSTSDIAATGPRECKLVTPGYYPSAFNGDGSVNTTTICPQGSYCPGNSTTEATADAGRRLTQAGSTAGYLIACPYGTWTQAVGASTIEQCLTPPGHYTNITAKTTTLCPAHSYRANWLPYEQAEAQACTACGVGVLAEKTDSVTWSYPNGTDVEVAVTSSPDDCYIQLGQGLYFETLTKTWRAKNCLNNTYGMTNNTFGLTPNPCRDCPAGTEANTKYSLSAPFLRTNEDGSGGFVGVMACVTKPGYGLTGRGGEKCDPGYYNEGNNYAACSKCPFGLTTLGAGLGITAADCVTDLGYGLVNGLMGECPIGMYGDEKLKNASIACKRCPTGRTTAAAGADAISDCQFCSAGYGGVECASLCGGVGLNATYGPSGRAMLSGGQSTPCLPCSADGQTVTYSFTYNMANDMFTPKTVARMGAASPLECLSEYSQINDGTYYLPLSSDEGVTVVDNVPTFTACTEECDKAQCQLITYDYNTKQCYVRVSIAPILEGEPWLALKVLPSGFVGTSPWSTDDAPVKPKALSTGMYVFYQEKEARAVGSVDENVPGRSTFTSVGQCLKACDEAGDSCSGITVLSTVAPVDIAKHCAFIRANLNNGVFKRTMIRADLNRLIFPSPFLCPSGYTQDANQNTPCTPLSTPVVVQLFMRATSAAGCTTDLINSVRDALTNFMKDPNSAYGVYDASVYVTVGCHVVPTGQRKRQLLQDEQQVDLYATITLSGAAEAGQKLLTACTTTATTCTGDTPAQVVGGDVIQGSIQTVPTASVQLVAEPYVTGEPYIFTGTYLRDGTPASAPVILTSDPGSVLSCFSTAGSTGVTTFTCNPLKEVSEVTVKLSGPTGDLQTSSVVEATVTVYNTTCLKGSIKNDTDSTCTPCERGTFAGPGAETCSPCADVAGLGEGFTTLRMFSFNESQCSYCRPGFASANCTACAKGTVRTGVRSAATGLTCSACDSGSTTDGTGQTSCSLCVEGYGGDGITCNICPKGQYRAGEALKNVSCDSCLTGFTTASTGATADGDCSICLAGYGGDACEPCAVGSYAVGERAEGTNCTSCSAGFTTAANTSTAASACSVCLPGYGGAACAQCSLGFYSAGGPAASTPCSACSDGVTTADVGSTSADDCSLLAPGRYAAAMVDQRITSTAACLVGFYCPGGDPATPVNVSNPVEDEVTIVKCTGNKDIFVTGATSASQCLCKAGFGGEGCTACDVGTYSAGNTLANCTACTGNKTTPDAGSTSAAACSLCLAGFGLASNTCTQCAAGTYSNGTTACQTCAAGKYSDAGASECTDCPAGKSSNAGGATCLDCAPGDYNPTAGGSCTSCGFGKTSPAGSDELADCVCDTGYTGASCDACDTGYDTNPIGGTPSPIDPCIEQA